MRPSTTHVCSVSKIGVGVNLAGGALDVEKSVAGAVDRRAAADRAILHTRGVTLA
jgi:hypothetical protein